MLENVRREWKLGDSTEENGPRCLMMIERRFHAPVRTIILHICTTTIPGHINGCRQVLVLLVFLLSVPGSHHTGVLIPVGGRFYISLQ
jgi:hypothetical protein